MYGKYLNDLDSAWYYFEKANTCNFEKNAAFYKDLGVVCGMTGRFADALKYFLKAIELDPNDAQTYYNAGVTYQQLGDNKNAAAYISKSNEMTNKQQ
jgi:Flp pilus assembly protein TadD